MGKAPPTKVLAKMSRCSSPKMMVKPPTKVFGEDNVGVDAKDMMSRCPSCQCVGGGDAEVDVKYYGEAPHVEVLPEAMSM